ncbi:MAG: hypothetical protein J0L70_30450 [Leptolyngbya sp. UWPOB_LEPTO1]|nr:hypothetical protein [Leptolyngbya sp. UWPOB_LEPTO1]
MFTPERIRQIAQAIQPQLPELLPADIAADLDFQLTALLKQANAGQPVEQQILDLLYRQEALRSQLQLETAKQFNPIPSNSAPIPTTTTFRCPHCDYTDTVPQVGMIPEPCSDHPNVPLIAA